MSTFEVLASQIRQPMRIAPVAFTAGAEERLVARLRDCGVRVVDYVIDADAYRRYIKEAGYQERYPEYYWNNIAEKSLEHFIAADLLSLSPGDIYIDIASEHSPVPEIYQRLYGVRSYRQDLSYAPGLHGDAIGSDAASMPVPESFASKLALHCSFEHFEGDSDIRFVDEVRRVLRPGGAMCVVPLYIAESYSVMTDPLVSVPEGVVFEPDATVHCVGGWGNRHGRFYDPEHLVERILQRLAGLDATVYWITNSQAIDPSCYARFALVLSKGSPTA